MDTHPANVDDDDKDTTASSSNVFATSMSMTSNSNSSNRSSPDTVVFGGMAFQIADKLCESLEAALGEQQVGSTTIMPGEPETLRALGGQLQRIYNRNVDVLESYLVRNIFTLQNVPAAYRHKIVQAFLNKNNDGDDIDNIIITNNNNDEKNKDNATLAKENCENQTVQVREYDYPSKSDVAQAHNSQEQLQQEVLDARHSLREAKRRRNALLAQLASLHQAHAAAQSVSTSLTSTSSSSLTTTNKNDQDNDAIRKLVYNKDRLEDLQSKAADLNAKLQDEAKHRKHDNGNNDDDDNDLHVTSKKQKLSLEQHYKEQRNKTKMQPSSLDKIAKLLKE